MTPYAIVLLICMACLLLSSLFHRMAYHLQCLNETQVKRNESAISSTAANYTFVAMLGIVVALVGLLVGTVVFLPPPSGSHAPPAPNANNSTPR